MMTCPQASSSCHHLPVSMGKWDCRMGTQRDAGERTQARAQSISWGRLRVGKPRGAEPHGKDPPFPAGRRSALPRLRAAQAHCGFPFL